MCMYAYKPAAPSANEQSDTPPSSTDTAAQDAQNMPCVCCSVCCSVCYSMCCTVPRICHASVALCVALCVTACVAQCPEYAMRLLYQVYE